MIRRLCRNTPILRIIPAVLLLAGLLTTAEPVRAELLPPFEKLPSAFDKKLPDTIDDLKAIETHVAQLVERVMPAVVCVRIGGSFGSGVIVTKEGHILTAAHVSAAPNQKVDIYFYNGKIVKGTTLGGNRGIDSGMIKINEKGDYPFVEMGNSAEVKKDQFCMVCSHPGGFKPGRTPPVRLGRVKGFTRLNERNIGEPVPAANADTLITECILVGGDSGGPLFDMHGRVIGINSRIDKKITGNMHVTVNPFKESWDKLAQGEVFGQPRFGPPSPTKGTPFIGVEFDVKAQACLIKKVTPDSPADKAGLKPEDVIVKADGKDLASGEALALLVRTKTPGNKMTLIVQRGEELLTLTVEIGKRSS